MRSVGAVIVTCILLAAATSAQQQPFRFIYNSDGVNIFIEKPPPMTPEDVYGYVDEVAGKGITTFFMCPNFGMTLMFPGKQTEMIGGLLSAQEMEKVVEKGRAEKLSTERGIANLRALFAAGHDPVGIVIDRVKQRGMEAFITFRLNEIHDVEHGDTSLIVSKFWRTHPDWRVGKLGDPSEPVITDILGPGTSPIVGTWFPGALNFAVPEVRALRLAELRECCERYPNLDGLDLDFQRFPIFFPTNSGEKNVPTLTAWLREVRGMTREISAKHGRPLLLSARVLATLEQNRAMGLDPATWAKEGLVDFLIVSHYLHNDFPLSLKPFKNAMPTDIPLYASIEVEPHPDTYKTIATHLRNEGADGISLFNFFTRRENGKEPPFDVLPELAAIFGHAPR